MTGFFCFYFKRFNLFLKRLRASNGWRAPEDHGAPVPTPGEVLRFLLSPGAGFIQYFQTSSSIFFNCSTNHSAVFRLLCENDMPGHLPGAKIRAAGEFHPADLSPQIRGVDGTTGILNDFRRETEPFGNQECIGTPRQADGQPVSRPQRLQIKFHAGIHRTRGTVSKCFQFRVMGGYQTGNGAFHQVREQGTCQRCTFLWVSPGAQFIQQDQDSRIGLLKNPDDVGDMAGEGGKRLFDGLFIANIGKYVIKNAERRPGLSRYVHARLRHKRQKPNCFRVTVFPPVFGPVIYHCKGIIIQFDIDRDDLFGRQQRMAGVNQPE